MELVNPKCLTAHIILIIHHRANIPQYCQTIELNASIITCTNQLNFQNSLKTTFHNYKTNMYLKRTKVKFPLPVEARKLKFTNLGMWSYRNPSRKLLKAHRHALHQRMRHDGVRPRAQVHHGLRRLRNGGSDSVSVWVTHGHGRNAVLLHGSG
jgi:Zn-dependent M16 (insulinase) family peptidase